MLAGQVLGMASCLTDHLESSFTQSYGPEARGGSCSAQLIVSDKPIHYPYVRSADILVCMSQTGFVKYRHMLKEDGTLIVDQDMVQLGQTSFEHVFQVPATRMAEELGRKMMANIVLLGFVTSVTGAASLKGMLSAVADSVPKGTEKTNIAAFNKGYDLGQAMLKARIKKAAAGNKHKEQG